MGSGRRARQLLCNRASGVSDAFETTGVLRSRCCLHGGSGGGCVHRDVSAAARCSVAGAAGRRTGRLRPLHNLLGLSALQPHPLRRPAPAKPRRQHSLGRRPFPPPRTTGVPRCRKRRRRRTAMDSRGAREPGSGRSRARTRRLTSRKRHREPATTLSPRRRQEPRPFLPSLRCLRAGSIRIRSGRGQGRRRHRPRPSSRPRRPGPSSGRAGLSRRRRRRGTRGSGWRWSSRPSR